MLFCLLIKINTKAQHLLLGLGDAKIEAGLNFGPTFFLGDLGGKVGKGTAFIKDLNYELTKLMKLLDRQYSIDICFKYNLTRWV